MFLRAAIVVIAAVALAGCSGAYVIDGGGVYVEPARRTYVDIPPGHYPPPGSCRVWFPDRPPGQQPPPGPCNVRVPPGAILVEG